MFAILTIGDLNITFENATKLYGFDAAKSNLLTYLTEENGFAIKVFNSGDEGNRVISSADKAKHIYGNYYPQDILINMVQFGLRRSYDKENDEAHDFFRDLRSVLKVSGIDENEITSREIISALRENPEIQKESPIRRVTLLLRDKRLVKALVTAYLDIVFYIECGKIYKRTFLDYKEVIKDSEIKELINHLSSTGKEKRERKQPRPVHNIVQITELRFKASLKRRLDELGNELYASFSNSKKMNSFEVGSLAIEHPTTKDLNMLAVAESEEKNEGVNIVLDRFREWFQEMDPVLINSDVEFNNLFPLALKRINFEVMTSSSMKPMNLSISIITGRCVYKFSCGGLITYTSDGLTKSFAREGTNNKFGTKNVEMDIINQTGYSSGNANQILLLTTEANRCLLSEESLKNPNITQEKIKKLTTKHPDKSMAFAYCERKRSE